MMTQFDELVDEFRQLPIELLALHVSAKAVFSFGLGAWLASGRKGGGWRMIGCLAMTLGCLMALPSTLRIFRRCGEK